MELKNNKQFESLYQSDSTVDFNRQNNKANNLKTDHLKLLSLRCKMEKKE